MPNATTCPHGFARGEASRCPQCRKAEASDSTLPVTGLDDDLRTAPPMDYTLPLSAESTSDGTLAVEDGTPRSEGMHDATYVLPDESGASVGDTVVHPEIVAIKRPECETSATAPPDEPDVTELPSFVTRPPVDALSPTENNSPPSADCQTLHFPGDGSAVAPAPSQTEPATRYDVNLWQQSRAPSVRPREGDETLAPSEAVPSSPLSATDPAVDLHPTQHLAEVPTDKAGSAAVPTVDMASSDQPARPAGGSATARREASRSGSFPSVAGYELLKELGRGGMGVVYKARHLKLNRVVALKMILGGRAGRSEMARFNAEAQAVAQLQHPNIVQLFEFGEQNGQPFFSLEYVEGGTLEEKTGRTPQQPRPAARVVELLAEAMDLAHRRGILHRDLKPANVLLEGTKEAALDQCVPKITDFGLAKKLEEGQSGLTRDGSVMGTPSYMAPEQAEGKIKELGPPADVYALGAILYDLLTGAPPFRGTTVMDTLRLVINNDPVPPAQLQPGLPHDLQIICLKCLEKDARKRYPTAGELAADLRRFLDHRPILARETPGWERLAKWTRRYPARAALVAVSALALLSLGTGGLLYARLEGRRATDARRLQGEAEDSARVAREQRDVADGQRRLALASLQQARDAVYVLTDVGDRRLAHVPGMESVRRSILETALEFNRQFVKTHADNPALRGDCGWALLRTGDIEEKFAHNDKAEDAYRAAQNEFRELLDDTPGNVEYREGLGKTRNNLAILQQKLRRPEEAQKTFDAAIAVKQALVNDFPGRPAFERDLANSHDGLGNLYLGMDKPEEAEKEYQNALSKLQHVADQTGEVEDKWKLARSHCNLGIVLTDRQPKLATEEFELALALCLDLTQRSSEDPRWRHQLALTHLARGVLRRKTARPPEEVDADFSEALKIFEDLVQQFRGFSEYRQGLADALINRGLLLTTIGRTRDAGPLWARAVAILRALKGESPGEPLYQYQFSRACKGLGFELSRTSQSGEAVKILTEGSEVLDGLVEKYPTNREYWQEATVCCKTLAEVLWNQAPSAETETAVGQLVDLHRRRVKAFPLEIEYQGKLASALKMQSELLLERRKPAPARAALEAAVAEQRTVWNAVRASMDARQKLAGRKALEAYSLALIDDLLTQGDHKAASKAVSDLQRDVPVDGKLPAALSDRDAAVRLVQCLSAAEKDARLNDELRSAARADYAGRAVTLLRQAVEQDPKGLKELKLAGEFLPLRDRDDFKKLVEEIEAKNGK